MTTKPVYILGISAFYHDSAACLVRDGKIVAAAQEERFTRKKHDASFPRHSVRYCLESAGIQTRDLDYVGFYEKPFSKFERLLLTYLTYAPFGIRSFLQSMPLWLKDKFFLKDLIRQELKYEGEIIFPEHHESHAASAFFPSPFGEAAVLTMDGVGEWPTATYGTGKGNRVELLAELRFPHSLGLLYSAFTYYIGFRVNSGEYKLMGLAPYGEPHYADLIRRELIDLKDDGSFKLNMKYFNYCAGLTMVNRHFCRLFGGLPRAPESELTQRHMDIASSIQVVTEEIMLKMAAHVHAETGMKNLCLAGGVALNCVGNGRILREGPFEKIWIQPAAGDAGGALGTALFIWYQYLNNARQADEHSDRQAGSLLGPQYGSEEILKALDGKGACYEHISDEELPGRIAELLTRNKVIGLCRGPMEFGPRALGNRSIIADARSAAMQSLLNRKIKFRESFRPFAPSVLEERCGEYFALDVSSPYMLLVGKVREDKLRRNAGGPQEAFTGLDRLKAARSVIPAVTHVDDSARIQTVSREVNPFFYRVIEEFDRRTGCPVIINTSFNVRGEPIVCAPQDAYRCFMCTEMDYLVIGNFLFDKTRQSAPAGQYQKEEISLILD